MKYIILVHEVKEDRDEDFEPITDKIILESLEGFSKMKKVLVFKMVYPYPLELLKHPKNIKLFSRRFNGLGFWGFVARNCNYVQGVLQRR